jgi:hypothetical protein
MHDRYADRVAFYVVYIKEAHPEDGWVVTHNRDDGIRMVEPATVAERRAAADTCAVRGALRIPVLVDGLDNDVARAYGGWPDRLYLVGRGGRVAFQGGPGPFEFKPEQLEAAIVEELDRAG